ncbi:hypothetical protein CHS0354_023340 [Potamilus streckersoni]|uniref:Uncharacterized protein n=1 Tax=Potamilus streckersoni TaxID=2493646 RepID=A0AAE0T4R2_9BIVA|nr:hypothetical protein CHS0354_023340 [Potamilus streckersoni]
MTGYLEVERNDWVFRGKMNDWAFRAKRNDCAFRAKMDDWKLLMTLNGQPSSLVRSALPASPRTGKLYMKLKHIESIELDHRLVHSDKGHLSRIQNLYCLLHSLNKTTNPGHRSCLIIEQRNRKGPLLVPSSFVKLGYRAAGIILVNDSGIQASLLSINLGVVTSGTYKPMHYNDLITLMLEETTKLVLYECDVSNFENA